MYKIILFSLLSMVLSQAGAADSKRTQMTGVSTVCSDSNSFFAFDDSAHRIWMGEGPFEIGDDAIELDQVTMTSKPNLLSFEGQFEMSWGPDIYLNLYGGSIDFLKSPVVAHITATPAGTKNGDAQPTTIVLQCHAIPLILPSPPTESRAAHE